MFSLQMDRYGNYHYHGGRSGLWRSLRDGDFEESEVWDVLRERRDGQDIDTSGTADRYPPVASHPPIAPRSIPRPIMAGSSPVSRSIFAHQSAPVNIPNWSNVGKHLGRSESSKAPKSRPWRDEDNEDEDEEEDEDNEDDGVKLPPHEYIAMRLARSKMSSFSVFEGVGRKLKGRDLSKVRNDVLTMTGFLECP
ncbi:hypothetical protein SAY87_021285 [Trapa incisa]|uniref:Senescence regulator n=1 Tax=Trapa incisa TaxID=236973 RepID=A0AAN7JSW8_9MYRT|nr:hypothetical protein SAY87_021285 [Trapa incisa]